MPGRRGRVPGPPAAGARRYAATVTGAPELVLHFDGGARGNPGPAAYGYVLTGPDGTVVESEGAGIGTATNNVAEYRGLIAGMRAARERGARRLRVRGDSELVVQQMRGAWKVRSPGLRPLHAEARDLARGFDAVSFEHVRRAGNSDADLLVNAALDGEAAG